MTTLKHWLDVLRGKYWLQGCLRSKSRSGAELQAYRDPPGPVITHHIIAHHHHTSNHIIAHHHHTSNHIIAHHPSYHTSSHIIISHQHTSSPIETHHHNHPSSCDNHSNSHPHLSLITTQHHTSHIKTNRQTSSPIATYSGDLFVLLFCFGMLF